MAAVDGTRQHGGRGDRRADDPTTTGRPSDELRRRAPDGSDRRRPVRHAADRRPSSPTEAPVDESWDDEWDRSSRPHAVAGRRPAPGPLRRPGDRDRPCSFRSPWLRSDDDSPAAADVTSAVVTLVPPPVDTSVPPAHVTAAPTRRRRGTVGADVDRGDQPHDRRRRPPTTSAHARSHRRRASAADRHSAATDSAELTTAPSPIGRPTATVAVRSTTTVVAGDFWIRLADASGVRSRAPRRERRHGRHAALPGRSICLPDGATVPAPPDHGAAGDHRRRRRRLPTAKPGHHHARHHDGADHDRQAGRHVPDDLGRRGRGRSSATCGPTNSRTGRSRSPSREQPRRTAKNSCCYGLFQINWDAHKSWLAGLGVTAPTSSSTRRRTRTPRTPCTSDRAAGVRGPEPCRAIGGRFNLDSPMQHCARSSMDRALDYGSSGWEFDSLRAHRRDHRGLPAERKAPDSFAGTTVPGPLRVTQKSVWISSRFRPAVPMTLHEARSARRALREHRAPGRHVDHDGQQAIASCAAEHDAHVVAAAYVATESGAVDHRTRRRRRRCRRRNRPTCRACPTTRSTSSIASFEGAAGLRGRRGRRHVAPARACSAADRLRRGSPAVERTRLASRRWSPTNRLGRAVRRARTASPRSHCGSRLDALVSGEASDVDRQARGDDGSRRRPRPTSHGRPDPSSADGSIVVTTR